MFLDYTHNVKATRWTELFCDVVPREGGKAYGVAATLERFGLEPEEAVSYTHLRAHETGRNLVCRLLLEKKKHLTTNTHNKLTNIKSNEYNGIRPYSLKQIDT